MAISNKKIFFLFIAIIALASFFRLWHLGNIPPGIYPDEAINANDAITSPVKIFYPANNGREGIFINLIALSFSIFGISIWSLKIVSAAAGILTVIGTYFLTKELFTNDAGKKQIALLSSFFLAISFWHINFSRIGFRAILVPLILTFSFYFLLKGFRNEKIYNFAISGIIFGLGFYTYIAFRLAVLLIPVVLLYYFLKSEKENRKKIILNSSIFLLFIFFTALPIGIYFLQNSEYFASRATGVSIFSQSNPYLSFLKSLTVHLGMFNFHGDSNWRHNFADYPQLYWSVGILFLIGLTISLKKIRSISSIILFSWLFVMILPAALTYEGIPHALRTIGTITPAYILAGLGSWYSYQYLLKKIANKKIFQIICWVFLFFLLFSQFNEYFIVWAKKPQVADAFTKNYTEIGYYLNSLPEETKKYVIVNELGSTIYGISIPAQTPMFIERTKFGKLRANYITTDEIDEIEKNGQIIIIPLYEGKELEKMIKERFPQIKIINKNYFKAYVQ